MTLLEFYNLQDILQMFGVDTSSNEQLKKWARNKLKMDIQVLMADEINEEIGKLSVINYQDSDEKGSHWVAFYNELQSFYFDPFGLEPLPNIPKCIYNSVQVQPHGTRLCGQLCLYFLFKLNKCECVDKSQKFDDIIEKMLDCLWPENLL